MKTYKIDEIKALARVYTNMSERQYYIPSEHWDLNKLYEQRNEVSKIRDYCSGGVVNIERIEYDTDYSPLEIRGEI